MAVLSNTGIRAGASGAGDAGYQVKRSTRFNPADTPDLVRTFSTGNRKTWTWSAWMKLDTSNGAHSTPFGTNSVNDNTSTFVFNFTFSPTYGYFNIGQYSASPAAWSRLYRDPTAWFHFVVALDTTQSTVNDRIKIYIDGVRDENISTNNIASTIAQDSDQGVNLPAKHFIGRYGELYSGQYTNGYMADIHFVDGTALAASEFGEANADTGQWVPKEYSGSYGTNGFHLAMDPANGGTNYSSEVSGVPHSSGPASNTFNGDHGGSSYSQGAYPGTLTWTHTGGMAFSSSLQIEAYIDGTGTVTVVHAGGTTNVTSQFTADSWDLETITGITSPITSIAWASTDGSNYCAVRHILIDGKELVDHSAIGYDSSGNKNHWHENNIFGSEHTVANENFKAVAYEGTGSSQTINCGFQPDFVWIKKRSGGTARVHALYDSVRGVQKTLETNSTDNEYTDTNALTHFTTTGFTVGSEDRVNEDTYPYVAWCWKAASASTTNDASSTGIGTIDSTYKANTDAGFSVVSYTGTGSNGTVAHGLGKAAKFIIVKGRDTDGMAWSVYHDAIGHNSGNNYIELQVSSAAGADNTAFQNTAPTSTVFSIGTKPPVNESGDDHIAYCWAETAGVSKFGSIAGGSDPIIDCGFTPAFIIVKRTDSGGHWYMYDKARGANPDNQTWLEANGSGAESDHANGLIKWLPNGFQLKGSDVDQSGDLIYAAWAGSPAGDLDLLADTPGAPYDNELNGGGNYATLNPLDNTGFTFSNGNLSITHAANSSWYGTSSTIGMDSGKWYCEMSSSTGSVAAFGLTSGKQQMGSDQYTHEYFSSDGTTYPGGASYGATFGDGDIIGIAFDADAGALYFYKNGVVQNSGTAAFTGLTGGPWFFSATAKNALTITANFGQRAFAYTPPTDYKALNTYNLPEPTIVKGNVGFETVLYDGTGSEKVFTGFEFSPDLVWFKKRSGSANHYLYDIIRGQGKHLYVDRSDMGEATSTTGLTAFGTEGYTIQDVNDMNDSGQTYVSWNWDAGSAGSNTVVSAGDLNSSVYNQSETWSSSLTSTQTFNLATTRAFDGDLSTLAATANATNSNILFTETFTGVTSLRVYMDQATTYRVRINSGTWHTDSSLGASSNAGWRDLTSIIPSGGTVNTIESDTSGANNGVNWSAVEVNGRLLIDSGVTPPTNVPTQASTYRVNTNTGLSIVSYSGGGSGSANTDSGDTFAHGLNAAPKFVICKKTSGANGWPVYHASTALGALVLNDTPALDTASYLFAKKHPTSTVVYLGNNPEINATGSDYIAYCWSEVAGYSKFGTYTGNGSTDGPFVWCGFKPRWILTKRTDGTDYWYIFDTARDVDNVVEAKIEANTSAAEHTTSDWMDILSNGFKLRASGGDVNASSGTYIFAAFAESPFKYSNAH